MRRRPAQAVGALLAACVLQFVRDALSGVDPVTELVFVVEFCTLLAVWAFAGKDPE